MQAELTVQAAVQQLDGEQVEAVVERLEVGG
ncbi:hypothetical protein JOF56_010134 [Kibdelosporangium banguiense]|uniref:Uncharacterized protein n=1 Tax=Kibdelosporangium banguiense TaxID=1365924 RepID=A0ABS4TZB0_9PSEU|nr:hypothetical protein [Kibdelosporangium banguiense]